MSSGLRKEIEIYKNHRDHYLATLILDGSPFTRGHNAVYRCPVCNAKFLVVEKDAFVIVDTINSVDRTLTLDMIKKLFKDGLIS